VGAGDDCLWGPNCQPLDDHAISFQRCLAVNECHFPGNNKSIYNIDPKEDTPFYFKTVFNDDHILQNIVK
jgi:hypothetical protein